MDIEIAGQYDHIAEQYNERSEYAPYNAYYERPATLKLVGDVAGKYILDIGCGGGIYSEIFLNAGAHKVVGFDSSAKMIEFAAKRIKENAAFHIADMSQPLSFLSDDYFDIAVSALVFHYVKDLDAVFHQVIKKLKKRGTLIFSVPHPFSDFRESKSGNYFSVELLEEYWPSFNTSIKTYRRSLESIFKSFTTAGFYLEQLNESQPVPELEKINKQLFEKLSTEPYFIFFKLVKK